MLYAVLATAPCVLLPRHHHCPVFCVTFFANLYAGDEKMKEVAGPMVMYDYKL
jgi:hypothetical protein